MRKGLYLFMAALLLSVFVPAFATASAAGNATIVSSVSFRSGPSTSTQVLKYLKAGTTVSVLDEVNSYWLKVKDSSGSTGYISSNSKYVSFKSVASVVSGANAVVVSAVSFRTAPSTSGARIRYLQKNEQVKITSVVNSYWYAVKDASNVTGYVSSQAKYIKITGSLSQTSAPGTAGLSSSQQVEKVIVAGMKYLGTPYEFGSSRNTTTTFDCSDFVRQAFKDALNIVLPASSSQQGTYVRNKNTVTTNWRSLKRGDLMFFMDYKGTKAASYTNKNSFSDKISHVGIYLGNGQVLHTYSAISGGVRTDSIAAKHWEYRFLFGGSAL